MYGSVKLLKLELEQSLPKKVGELVAGLNMSFLYVYQKELLKIQGN